MTRLPPTGHTSPVAVGHRLLYGRKNQKLSEAKAAKLADVKPAQWRKLEAGKATITPRLAWLFAVKAFGPVEWLLTGRFPHRDVPSPLPELGLDLSRFATRMRQTRERLSLTLDDIKAGEDETHIWATRWRVWEAGIDEPEYGLLERLTDFFEVDLTWLYTDTGRVPADAQAGRHRRLTFPDRFWMPGHYDDMHKRLRQARELSGLSLNDAAAITGFKPAKLRAFESGREHIVIGDDDDAGTVFAALYNVRPDWLCYGDDGLTVLKRRLERFKRRKVA